MSALEELREAARQRRDAMIDAAKAEYRATLRDLNVMARKLGQPLPRKQPRRTKRKQQIVAEYASMTVRQAAESVLSECGPLSIVELTIEVQRRGCRSGDEPRAVSHAIRAAMQYHRGRFFKDGDGRWVLR